jgi:hypothetical protein
MEQARTNNGSSESEKAFVERKEREAQREEARQVLDAERDARRGREADREEKRAENREAREAEEHAARMGKMQQGPGEAEQRFAELLGVGIQVAGIYKPVAEAHVNAVVAGFKTDTCFEEVKQELLSRILKAQTPEELAFIQKQLAASHEVATVK